MDDEYLLERVLAHIARHQPKDFIEPPVDPNTMWETKDGTVLLVKDMDSGHLVNCMKLLERRYGFREAAPYTIIVEPWDDGPCWVEEDKDLVAPVDPSVMPGVYFTMKEELKKRAVKETYGGSTPTTQRGRSR